MTRAEILKLVADSEHERTCPTPGCERCFYTDARGVRLSMFEARDQVGELLQAVKTLLAETGPWALDLARVVLERDPRAPEVDPVVDAAMRSIHEHTERILSAIIVSGFTPASITKPTHDSLGTEEHPRVVLDAEGQPLARIWCAMSDLVLQPRGELEPHVATAYARWFLRYKPST
jgi:hypothetical protein